MKVSGMLGANLELAPLAIGELEQRGYDSAFSAEINNDPFLPLVLAAEHSERIALTTSISVAFARNPMTVANLAWDLNQYAKGRFSIGLGSQIQQHITRRFSMPWSKPALRMREFVQAMRAIWRCWETGEKLDFQGEFYRHDLMTPMFVPAGKEHGAPGVYVAAVGPRMTETAGEVADGMIAHGFTTVDYLTKVTIPALEKGLAESGRDRQAIDLCCPVMVVAGTDEQAFEQSRQVVKGQLAFYASTLAYRPVLELHGWGDLQTEANAMTRQGRWQEMGELVTEEILETFAVVSEDLDSVPRLLKERYGPLVDTWQCTVETGDRESQIKLINGVRAL
jgi:probable F420-dependent oxidoreductase